MPEEINQKTIFSLLEVTKSIQNTISERYQQIFWVKAEMNKLNHYPHSGHCYPELVQKAGGKIIAEMKSIIWREDFLRINALFLRILHEPLKNGITILFAAKISYDPVYGLSLRITDIDPSYSLGDLEREKNETIEKLRKELLFDLNRQLKLPILPKRIAVVSVQTSKGYSDFLSVLDGNPFGYRFFHLLFPALLQGEKAVESIMFQLERIYRLKDHFDAIAIIRGGGGDVGLNCYNNYDLAAMVSRSPLPVITGIGHSTNETVTEMVAFKNAITPTELADFLIQSFHNFAVPVQRAQEKIIDKAGRMLKEENSGLWHTVKIFKGVTTNIISRNQNLIGNLKNDLSYHSGNFWKKEKESLSLNLNILIRNVNLNLQKESSAVEHLRQKTILLDPVNILRRGYSITKVAGKSVTSIKQIEVGITIETFVSDGSILSNVIIKNSENNG